MIVGSMVGTSYAALTVNQFIVGSGTQPVTMCAEYKAAEITRMTQKPCQSVEGKTMIQNPQFMYAQSWATGRATGKFMPGDEIRVVNVAEE